MQRLIAVPLLLAAAGIALVIGLYHQAVVNLDTETVQSHSRLYRQLVDTQSQRLESFVAATAEETRRWAAVLGGKGSLDLYLEQIVTVAGEYPVRLLNPDLTFVDPLAARTFLDGVSIDRFPGLRERIQRSTASGGTEILDGVPWNRDGRGLLIVSPIGARGEGFRGYLVREIPWEALAARFFGTSPGGPEAWYVVVGSDGTVIEPPPGKYGGRVPLREFSSRAGEAPVSALVGPGGSHLVVFGRPAGWLREVAGVVVVRIPVRVEVGINPLAYVALGSRVAEMVGEYFPAAPPTRDDLAARLPELRSKLNFSLADVEVIGAGAGEARNASVGSTGHPEFRLTEWHPFPEAPAISVVEVVAPYRTAARTWGIGIVQPLDALLQPAHAGMRQSLLVAFGIMLILVTMGLVMAGVQRSFYRRRVEEAEARIALEEEVRHAKVELQGIVDGIDTGILLADGEGRVQRVNRSLAHRAGKAPGELIGTPVSNLLPAWIPWPVTAPGGSAPPVAGVWEGRRVEAAFYPIGGTEGESRQTVVTVQDVTERLTVEERLRMAEKLAATSTLVAGVAHEIKNPLNSMSLSLGNLSFILGKLGDETLRTKGNGYVDRLREDIRRLTLLVNRFMEVARPVPEERRPVDLSDVARVVVDRFAEQARLQRIEVRLEAAGLPAVLLEPTETERAVENLVVNAMEAMPDGGVLTVRTALTDREVALEVEDTGPGVPAEIGGRIFDIFFTTKEEGTGLGLSIVYRAVEGQGGRVEVRSEAGRGALFRITFPIS